MTWHGVLPLAVRPLTRDLTLLALLALLPLLPLLAGELAAARPTELVLLGAGSVPGVTNRSSAQECQHCQ